MASISADELNFVVYLYLLDLFPHSAFTFSAECQLTSRPLYTRNFSASAQQPQINSVLKGLKDKSVLEKLVKNGVMWADVEASIRPDGTSDPTAAVSSLSQLLGLKDTDGTEQNSPTLDSISHDPSPSQSSTQKENEKSNLNSSSNSNTTQDLKNNGTVSHPQLYFPAKKEAPESSQTSILDSKSHTPSIATAVVLPAPTASALTSNSNTLSHSKRKLTPEPLSTSASATATKKRKQPAAINIPLNVKNGSGPSPSASGVLANQSLSETKSSIAPTAVSPTDSKAFESATYPTLPSSAIVSTSDVKQLKGHQGDVFVAAWNPMVHDMIATGSGDATARIWDIGSSGNKPIVAQHIPAGYSKDITTLAWNCTGTLLATGSHDTHARIWTADGEMHCLLSQHTKAVLKVSWSPLGSYLLTSSADGTSIVWNPSTGRMISKFATHKDSVVDSEWQSDHTFATCSNDGNIYVFEIDQPNPIRSFLGHLGEVNQIRWDPTKMLLASAGDDKTARIWTKDVKSKPDRDGNFQPAENPTYCMFVLRGHTKELYTIEWSPTPGPNKARILCTASFDNTAKLWDAHEGECIGTFSRHTQPIYSLAFSPDGRTVATGSLDKHCVIWKTYEQQVLQEYVTSGSIYDLKFRPDGQKLAICHNARLAEILTLEL